MGPGSFLARTFGVIGILLCFSGIAFSGTQSIEGKPILVAKGDSLVRVDKKALDILVSGMLDVLPGTLSYLHLPDSFPVSDTRGVRGELQLEGRDGLNTHLALLVKRGDVVQEMFYFTARMGHRSNVSGKIRSKNTESVYSTNGEGVRSGDTVRIQAVGTGFVISLSGIAQESGQTGDHIAVFNPMSGSRVQATVTGPDRVRIHLKGTDHAAE